MALQLTGGDAADLIGGPVSYVVYAVIAPILLWPLVRKAVPRLREWSPV